MTQSRPLRAAIAAHRFGLGEPSLDRVASEPAEWLTAQIGPADAPRGEGLLDTAQALRFVAEEREARRAARRAVADTGAASGQAVATSTAAAAARYRAVALADLRSRTLTAVASLRPFAERLQWFWCNHFTVSRAKAGVRGLVGAFERDAIRPNIAGSFEQLLVASTTHPAMLAYLDNQQSAGPHSPIVARSARRAERLGEPPRIGGLNENLAREVLELHTLGAASTRGAHPAYTQADVIAFAQVLTGWRVRYGEGQGDGDAAQRFNALWHEPGAKTLLDKTYAEGPEALHAVLHDLARHPATARFIATKLAQHFVADEPPPPLVERLAASYRDSDGQLGAVYRTLIASPEPWQTPATKLKTPEEFVISSLRVLQLDGPIVEHGALGIGALGQRVQAAPSPAGWSDRAADWLGPDAVWKRVEWATRVANRFGGAVDARRLAAQSLGPLLKPDAATQIARAADASQAVALLLMTSEFQRR